MQSFERKHFGDLLQTIPFSGLCRRNTLQITNNINNYATQNTLKLPLYILHVKLINYLDYSEVQFYMFKVYFKQSVL